MVQETKNTSKGAAGAETPKPKKVEKTPATEAPKEKPAEAETTKPKSAPVVDDKEMLCTSCGKRVEAERFWVRFFCPSCAKAEIIRCEKCKSLENKYTCSACSFQGP